MKVFQVGVDDTTLLFLSSKGFAPETAEIESPEDLFDWLIDGSFAAAIIDLDRTNWGQFAVRYLRSKNVPTPVIGISTGEDAEVGWSEFRSEFLENGGDDLLHHPVNPRELAATLRATSRRGVGATYDVRMAKFGDAIIRTNLSANIVSVNGEPLHLTGKEMLLMAVLATSNGRTVSKEMVLSGMYSATEDEPEIKIVDVFVCKLRKKLSAVHPDAGLAIETVWGAGYRLRMHSDGAAEGKGAA